MRLFLLVVGTALASPAAGQTDLPADVADGMYVTVAEIRSNSFDTFQAFAGTGGGPISKEQFVSTNLPDHVVPDESDSEVLGRLFNELDANSDGQVTLSEWKDGLDTDLQFADQNGDGRVTLKELSNARENMNFGDALGVMF